ncbi:MAG: aminotransferase class V-fold PLP-dependent enzyme, partial [Chlamydiia bacterium]|nr:aminotransferase class V-fold PLP-dependent enzyme [Chlamydiia bacterium]
MIYLDHNATTPIDARVLQEICQVEQSIWGNPSSSHVFGQKARSILDQTKREIASFFSVFPEEVFFTSCATEGLNTILRSTKGHIITSSLEHEAVFQTAKALEREGVPLTFL